MFADDLRTQLPGAVAKPLQGTYLQFVDCRGLGIDGNPQRFFLENARVAITDGSLCGDAGVGFVRINLATPTPILREIVARMGAALR